MGWLIGAVISTIVLAWVLFCLNLSADPAESQAARQSDQSIMEHMMILCVIALVICLCGVIA